MARWCGHRAAGVAPKRPSFYQLTVPKLPYLVYPVFEGMFEMHLIVKPVNRNRFLGVLFLATAVRLRGRNEQKPIAGFLIASAIAAQFNQPRLTQQVKPPLALPRNGSV